MDPLYVALFSWAVSLSGLSQPAELPLVVRVPHAFFVEHACGGRPCRVYGWYAGGREVYVDQSLDPQDSLLAASVVVHEMVHYLQGTARNDGLPARGVAFGEAPSCTEAIDMERAAYGVQREFIHRHGIYQPVGISMMRVGCIEEPPPPQP